MTSHAIRTRSDVLPASLPPRGVNRVQAAAYIGVSPTKFDQLVADGRMPKPRIVDSRRVWDVWQLDMAFSALPNGEDERDANPWDGRPNHDESPLA